jgi:hypothetical protein
MYIVRNVAAVMGIRGNRILGAAAAVGIVLLSFASIPAAAADAAKPPPIKIAVFDFELDDLSPAASVPGGSTSSAAVMAKVTSAARRVLEQSGRYSLVDVSKADAKPVTEKLLRHCDGCEAGIALQLGADQSLLGVVRKATMTDYYVLIQISDARTGKVLTQEAANFAGGDDGWASGVTSMIRHQVLAVQN